MNGNPPGQARLDTLYPVETPEGIVLTLRPAGPIPRALAWALDGLIRYTLLLALAFPLGYLGEAGMGLWLLALFLLEWLYPVPFELYGQGATPGKKALGLRVINDDGTPVTAAPSLIRNLLRAVDFLPLAYGFGLAAMVADRHFRRLGDLAAGTLVVHDSPVPRPPVLSADQAPLAPPRPLAPDEQALIVAYAERDPALSADRSRELADLLQPLTGATGEEGRQRLLAQARWLTGAGP